MVMIGQAALRKCFPQKFSKPPFHPVADNRIADSFGNGDPVTFAKAVIGTRQQNKTGPRNAQPVIGSQKVFTLPNNRQS